MLNAEKMFEKYPGTCSVHPVKEAYIDGVQDAVECMKKDLEKFALDNNSIYAFLDSIGEIK
jgi:hypothetical protein